ncbi:LIM domain only protein 7-like isoform X2 [Rhinoraja longicauda]
MERKGQSDCNVLAFTEGQRWVEEVTGKRFGQKDFRSALEDGVLLCELVNKIKPGVSKKINRLSTPIAGLDNVNVFLKGCQKIGLKEAQLFHPGDLQDLSSRVTVKREETERRLKNVLITIYWLGRRARSDPHYNGPYLDLSAFEGLLGQTLTKALADSGSLNRSGRDSGYCDIWCAERTEPTSPQFTHRRDDSFDSLDSFGSKSLTSLSSEVTLKESSEGGGSDIGSEDLSSKWVDGPKNNMSLRNVSTSEYKPALPYNQFLPSKNKPSTYVPAPLRKKRAGRNEDNRRSWASPMFTESDGSLSRLLRMSTDNDSGSKSLNDVSAEEEDKMRKSLRYEEMQEIKKAMNEQDQQWQSDLAVWKNRRKSVNSDLQKKKDERDEIEKMSSEGSPKATKTYRKIREERELRQQDPSSGNQTDYRKLNSSDEEVFVEERKPRQRLSERSHTVATETPFTFQKREPVSSAPAPGRQPAPELKNTVNNMSEGQSTLPLYVRHSVDHKADQTRVSSSLPRNYQRPGAPRIAPVVAPRSYGTQPKKVSLTRTYAQRDEQPKYNGDVNGSKHFQAPSSFPFKSESATPMESGELARKESEGGRWLSPFLKTEEKRSEEITLASKPENDLHMRNNVSSNEESDMYPRSNYSSKLENDDQSQGSSLMSSNEEEGEEEEEARMPSLSENNFPHASKADTTSNSATMNYFTKETSQPTDTVTTAAMRQRPYSETRIVINQKPNSNQDFGFTTDWTATGVTVKSIERGGPAEYCQLEVGDEISTINGNNVANMDHQAWLEALEDARKTGNLNMEVRKYENNSASEMKYSISNEPIRWETTGPTMMTSRSQPFNQLSDLPQSGENEKNFPEDSTQKASEPISLKNFKRRSQFFEQGGPETAVSDEEYQHAQEKLEEEWKRAQREAEQEGSKYYEEERKILQETNTPRSPFSVTDGPGEPRNKLSSRNWSTSWDGHDTEEELGDEEEDERQREDEEARRQEEIRLQEERERERQEKAARHEQERKLQEEKERERHEQRQRELERQKEERRQRQQAEEQALQAEAERAREFNPRWPKSKSTSELDEVVPVQKQGVNVGTLGGVAQWLPEEEKMPRSCAKFQDAMRVELETQRLQILNQMKYADPERGDLKSRVSDSAWIKNEAPPKTSHQKEQPLSHAEQERKKILQEMRRKTQLLNDNSWIRQRSASVLNKNADSDYASLRRGESLDNLDTPKTNTWGSTSKPVNSSEKESTYHPVSTSNRSYMRAPSSTLPPRSTGSVRTASWAKNSSPPLNTQSVITQGSRSISGKKICSYCDSALGKGAAMIIESLGLCYHLHCFKCISCSVDLGGTESGAEVRVRNNKLFCNACYTQFKVGQTPSN